MAILQLWPYWPHSGSRNQPGGDSARGVEDQNLLRHVTRSASSRSRVSAALVRCPRYVASRRSSRPSRSSSSRHSTSSTATVRNHRPSSFGDGSGAGERHTPAQHGIAARPGRQGPEPPPAASLPVAGRGRACSGRRAATESTRSNERRHTVARDPRSPPPTSLLERKEPKLDRGCREVDPVQISRAHRGADRAFAAPGRRARFGRAARPLALERTDLDQASCMPRVNRPARQSRWRLRSPESTTADPGLQKVPMQLRARSSGMSACTAARRPRRPILELKVFAALPVAHQGVAAATHRTN